ncbi:MAG: YfhO family protein, partial [Candidatus Omnitrophica bacterium]|nr:YfhO family protein [Candidatus Omnitrophota bacterium]
AKRVTLGNILAAGLESRVVAVDSQNGEDKDLLSQLPTKDELKKTAKEIPSRVSRWEFDLRRAKKKVHSQTIELIFKLPKNFPEHFATDVFTNDWKLWAITIAGQNLSPVQGSLVEPFTFDVRNIHSDELRILLPKDYSLLDRKATLEIQSNSLLLDIWKNQYDHLGFDYQAPQDGWLVLHYPYDPKWRLTVDGARVQFSKVNGYFMGVRLAEGKHKISLEYWPDTPVRGLIVFSTILVFAALGTVLFLSFRDDGQIIKRISKV